MIAYSIRHCLNEHWSLLLNDQLPSMFAGVVDGKDVVAVHTDGVHAVGDATNYDTVSSILIINGGRDGVHVIPAEEHGLASEGGSKVKCSMEVSLTGSSLTEIGHSYAILVLDSVVVASTGGLRDLGAQGRGDSHDVVSS